MDLLGVATDDTGARFRLYYLDDSKGRRGCILGPTCSGIQGMQTLELVGEFSCAGREDALRLLSSECLRRGWAVAWNPA